MENVSSDIVVIGSLNMDLVVSAARMPGAGETLHGETFHMIPGGKGANQAVAAARLGGRVAMVGRVGHDSFADGLRQNLAANQVDTRYVQTDPAASTGVALIVVEANGENRILVVGGANQAVSLQDVNAAEVLLGKAKLLLVQFEVPMPTVAAVLRAAQRLKIPVMVNAAPAYAIAPELLPLIEYLVVNEHEAELLSGAGVSDLASAAQASRRLIAQGARQVVLTLGALGALVCSPTQEFSVPGFTVSAIDTTAAGDAFIGGLAVALQEGGGLCPEKVRFANAAGAIAATRLGAQSSLPTRFEVDALLATHA
jgi:ribokinase